MLTYTGRLVTRIRRNIERSRTLAYGLAVLVVAGAVVAAGSNDGYPAEKMRLLSGAAWLPANQVGQLVLVDGPAAEVAARINVAAPGHRLDFVQDQASGYALDRTARLVHRIDGDTLTPSDPRSIPDAGESLRIHLGRDVLYTLDSQSGVLTGRDPETLAIRGPVLPLAAGESSTAVDGDGGLWVLNSRTGDLTWVLGDQHDMRHAAEPGAATIVTANGSPVLIDHSGQTAAVIDPATGGTRHSIELSEIPLERVEVGGSQDKPRLYVVSADGRLAVCDLGETTCEAEIPLAVPSADLGTPVEAGETLFVPDYTNGRVWVADLRGRRVVAQPQVLSPGVRFQLVAHNGILYFNDPDSEHAGVIRSDGEVVRVTKYKPPERGRATQPKPDGPSLTPGTSAPVPSSATATGTGRQPPTSTSTGETPSVRIVLSTYQPEVGEEVTLKVTAESRPDPVGALWDFGDGTGAGEVRTSHRWTAAGTYQIGVRATFLDGRAAVATLPVNVGATTKSSLVVQASGAGTVTSQPAGISCPPTCYAIFDIRQPVTLTAQPNNGFGFLTWDGDCSGKELACTVLMDSTKLVTASFEVPANDFTIARSNRYPCVLRHSSPDYWDVDLWFLVGWTSANGTPIPNSKISLVTDIGISDDWPFHPLDLKGNEVNTLVESDPSYLGRVLRVTITIDPDDEVVEASEANNTIVLAIDLRTPLPPPSVGRKDVECHQE